MEQLPQSLGHSIAGRRPERTILLVRIMLLSYLKTCAPSPARGMVKPGAAGRRHGLGFGDRHAGAVATNGEVLGHPNAQQGQITRHRRGL